MLNIRSYPNLKFIQLRKCKMLLKPPSLSWVVMNYVNDISIYEPCILPLYLNHVNFFWQTYEPKICCYINLYHFFYLISKLWWLLWVVLWCKNSEFSLQGNRLFHLSSGHGLNVAAYKYFLYNFLNLVGIMHNSNWDN